MSNESAKAEVHSAFHHFAWAKFIVLGVNTLLVAYLFFHLVNKRRRACTRWEAQAAALSRHHAVGRALSPHPGPTAIELRTGDDSLLLILILILILLLISKCFSRLGLGLRLGLRTRRRGENARLNSTAVHPGPRCSQLAGRHRRPTDACPGALGRRSRAHTGTTVVIRLSAFLLLCIGVQIVWNGADALLGSVRLQVK